MSGNSASQSFLGRASDRTIDGRVREALRIRAFEQQLLERFSQGHVRGTVHTCLGQELTPVCLSTTLCDKDRVFGTHRGHGYVLALTGAVEPLAREILGREGGVSSGIGGSQHVHAGNVITNGIQGGLMPVAVGASTALDGGVAVAVIGDGTLGQGVVYESLNIAAKWSAPTLVLIEDNDIAQSTPSAQTRAGSLRLRFEAFGVRYSEVVDTDLLALQGAIDEAVGHVRTEQSPMALRVKTKRLGPHSKGDDNRGRMALSRLHEADYLNRCIEDDPEVARVWRQAQDEMERLFEGLLKEPEAQGSASISMAVPRLQNVDHPPNLVAYASQPSIREAIRDALAQTFMTESAAIMIGEDIEAMPPGMERLYNGAFGVSGDLSQRFAGRVRNTPISEQGIVGFGIGRALAGSPTIVEIMFGDFLSLCVDQLRQQASKMVGVYGTRTPLPLVVRTPTGGRRGYGPTHSQSTEGLLIGSPNIVSFAISPFGVEPTLFQDLLALELPVVLFENKDLYGMSPIGPDLFPAYELVERSSRWHPHRVVPRVGTASATIVTYGGAASLVLEALEQLAVESEIFVDLVVPEVICPLDARLIARSVERTGRLVLVEEARLGDGIGAELLAGLERAGHQSRLAFRSVAGKGDIGASRVAEAAALISTGEIVDTVNAIVRSA